MRNSWGWVVLVAAGFLPARGQAQRHDIAIKSQPDAGKSILIHDSSRQTGTIKLLSGAGLLLQEKKTDEIQEEVVTRTILEAGDKLPRKYRHVYTRAVQGEKPKPYSYQGRTILYEWKDGKYVARADGQPDLDARDLQALTERANEAKPDDDKLFLPERPMPVGVSWAVDVRRAAQAFPVGEADPQRSTAEGKLLRVYPKDGRTFGVLEVNLKFALKTVQGLKCDPPASAVFTITLDTAIDGGSTAGTLTTAGKIRGKAQFEEGGKPYVMELDLDITGRTERSAEK